MVKVLIFTLILFLFISFSIASEFESVSISFAPKIYVGLKQKVQFNFMQQKKNKFIAENGSLLYDDVDFFIKVYFLYTIEILKIDEKGDAIQSRVIFEKTDKTESGGIVKYPLKIGEPYIVELKDNKKIITLNGKITENEMIYFLNLLPSKTKEIIKYDNVIIGATTEKETTGSKDSKSINGYKIFYEKISDRIDKIKNKENVNNNLFVFVYSESSKYLMDEITCKQNQILRSEIEMDKIKTCEISLSTSLIKRSITKNNRLIKTEGFNKDYQSNGYGFEETTKIAASACEAPVIIFLTKSLCPGQSIIV
jgi:predicted mannosyl-3-phosphoglycerate phosphatase (HAD superfamily)